VLVFQKVARSCSQTKKLLKILKVAEKLPSRIWIGLLLEYRFYILHYICGLQAGMSDARIIYQACDMQFGHWILNISIIIFLFSLVC